MQAQTCRVSACGAVRLACRGWSFACSRAAFIRWRTGLSGVMFLHPQRSSVSGVYGHAWAVWYRCVSTSGVARYRGFNLGEESTHNGRLFAEGHLPAPIHRAGVQHCPPEFGIVSGTVERRPEYLQEPAVAKDEANAAGAAGAGDDAVRAPTHALGAVGNGVALTCQPLPRERCSLGKRCSLGRSSGHDSESVVTAQQLPPILSLILTQIRGEFVYGLYRSSLLKRALGAVGSKRSIFRRWYMEHVTRFGPALRASPARVVGAGWPAGPASAARSRQYLPLFSIVCESVSYLETFFNRLGPL